MSQHTHGPLMESGSSIGTFLDCPKKYEFKYIKLLDSRYYSANLGYGSFIHAFIEEFHASQVSGATSTLLEAVVVDWERDQISEDFLKRLTETEPLLPTSSLTIISTVSSSVTPSTPTEITSTPRQGSPLSPRPSGLESEPDLPMLTPTSPSTDQRLFESSPMEALAFIALYHPTAFTVALREWKHYPEQAVQIANELVLARAVAHEWILHWQRNTTDLGNSSLEIVIPEREWKFGVSTVTPGSETQSASPQGPGLNFHLGKSDAVVKHKTYPGHFLYELKTSGMPNREAYKHKLELDKQIGSNLIAMARDGMETGGVFYDIIWKPLIRKKTDRKTMPDETTEEFFARIIEEYKKTPEKYFERLMVFRSGRDLADYATDLIDQYAALRSVYERGRFYRNTNSCDKYGSLCTFFQPCMDRHTEELEDMFRKREKKLPELSEEIQQENHGT